MIRSEVRKIGGRTLYIDADDLSQVGWIGVLQAARRYDPNVGESFVGFVRARARGAMLDEVRRVQRSIAAESYEFTPQIPTGPDWGRIERDCDIATAVAGLSWEEQRLLRQIYASGYKVDDIARDQGNSRVELRRVHRNALRTLRERLDASG